MSELNTPERDDQVIQEQPEIKKEAESSSKPKEDTSHIKPENIEHGVVFLSKPPKTQDEDEKK